MAATNRGSLTNHQKIACKTRMTNTEIGQGNFQEATTLGTRRPWTKGRFQLSQFIAIRNILVTMGLPGGTDGTPNRGNVVLKG